MSNREADLSKARAALFSSSENPFASRSKSSKPSSSYRGSDDEMQVIGKLPKDKQLPQIKNFPVQYTLKSFRESDMDKTAKNSSNKDRSKRRNKKKSQTREANLMPTVKSSRQSLQNKALASVESLKQNHFHGGEFKEQGQGDFSMCFQEPDEMASLRKILGTTTTDFTNGISDEILNKLFQFPTPGTTTLIDQQTHHVATQTENDLTKVFRALRILKALKTLFLWLLFIFVPLTIWFLFIKFDVKDLIYKRFIQKEEPPTTFQYYYQLLTSILWSMSKSC